MKDSFSANFSAIYNGNNLDVLKKFEDNSIDSLISDFPYALSFMNAKWDTMPRLEMLKEFYRVLKTGAFLVTTFTPRLDLQSELCMLLKEAGFDVSFSPIYWAYKTGFPKASNYGKVIQKNQGVPLEDCGEKLCADGSKPRKTAGNFDNTERDQNSSYFRITKPTTPEAQYCEGLYSLNLKPAVEPIIIAQKPHNKAKYKQALDWYYERKELLDKGIPEEDLSLYTKNASGGVWIDNTRIPTSQEDVAEMVKKRDSFKNLGGIKSNFVSGELVNGGIIRTTPTNGRFPANLLCGFPISKEELRSEYPEATEEELEKMVNMIENPLDVGRETKSSDAVRRSNQSKTTGRENGAVAYGKFNDHNTGGFSEQGDLSRYFSLTAWNKKHFPNLHNIAEKTLQLQDDVKKTGDCLFVCKPAESEKNAGLDGFEEKRTMGGGGLGDGTTNALGSVKALQQNTHPTTKPISLYNYLITLFSKEGDIILDPFCGSGATPIACVLTNRKYIGIEMEEEYHKIAEARVEYWKQQKEGVKSASACISNVSASKKEEQETLL